MFTLLTTVFSQIPTFLPLAFAVYISFFILRATDMTLDGSFVLGAAVFAKLIELNFSPIYAALCALFAGAISGMGVALIQRKQKIDSLLAGILATFVLMSVNLIVMGRPNISLLSKTTLISNAFLHGELYGQSLVAIYSISLCILVCLLLLSRHGLSLRAFGDNENLLLRLGKNIENHRIAGFALTNSLAAASGCLTSQTIGYADVGMGFGMTLTALGAVILGKQVFDTISNQKRFKIAGEFISCLVGVLLYFFAINSLLRLNLNPIYLKMFLGIILIFFLRIAKLSSLRKVI